MEKKVDYNVLDKIPIENYDLIIPTYGCVHQFCVRNKINTLGELLRKVDNKKVDLKNNKFKDELLGFIDLVKYRHFGLKLPREEIFNEVVTFVPNSTKGEYHPLLNDVRYNSIYKNSFRRLGFTNDEADLLELFVKDSKESKLIIDVIMSFKKLNKRKYPRRGIKDILDIKLDIYNEYLSKQSDFYNTYEFSKYIELDNLFRRINNLKEKRKAIDIIIDELKEEIKENSKYINEENIKKLMKKYEDK